MTKNVENNKDSTNNISSNKANQDINNNNISDLNAENKGKITVTKK